MYDSLTCSDVSEINHRITATRCNNQKCHFMKLKKKKNETRL